MCAKSFGNRFPLSKLNRKRDRKRGPSPKDQRLARKSGRGERGISRRDRP